MMAWYSRARPSFKTSISSFRVKFLGLKFLGLCEAASSFISISLSRKLRAPIQSGTIDLPSVAPLTLEAKSRYVKSVGRAGLAAHAINRSREGPLHPSPERGESDLRRRFLGFAIGALAFISGIFHIAGGIVDILFHVVGGVVHTPLSAANPFPTCGHGPVESILRTTRYLIACVFARLRRKQNPQCRTDTNADNERRSGFLPT